jgi:CRP/FNR family transcriptional regulator, nitrogen oxide reductase regulator
MAAVDRSLVAKFPLFKEFHAEALDAILSEARCDRYPKSTAVFQQGEQATSFFVLLHGHVRASKATPAGDQIVVRYVSPGEIFGVTTAIGLDRYPATATAVDDSVVLSWPSAKWPSLVAQHPSLAVSTLQMVGSRLQETHTRVVEMSTEQVEQRIAHALLRLAKQAGRKVEHGIKIDFPISRQDVAEMTGTTLHTVSRTLSAWEQQGLVESARQSIVLRDPHRLFIIAERGQERGQGSGGAVQQDDANASGPSSPNMSP